MLPEAWGCRSEGKSDGGDSGQHCSPHSPGFGGDPVHFWPGDGAGRDVLALAQGIEGNRPSAHVEIDANQVIAVTYRPATLRKSHAWLTPVAPSQQDTTADFFRVARIYGQLFAQLE